MKTLELILTDNYRVGILSQRSPVVIKIIYLFACSMIAAVLLYQFAFPFLSYFNLNTSFALEITEVNSQIFFQGTVIYFLNRKKMMPYLLNMVTISLIGGLLFIPALVIQFFIGPFDPYLLLIYFGAVVLIMFILHIKACKKLQISYVMSISWVLYRFIILYFTFQ